MGSKAAPAEIIPACSAIIDQASNPASDRVAALLVRADANARTSGGLTQALRDIDRAIALDGKNARAWRLRGDLLREAGGDLNRATADLSKAIELDPQDAEAYELRGVAYTNQRRLDRALADYDKAIKLKPDYAQAWSDRGATYYLNGDNDKAIARSQRGACGSIRTGRAATPIAARPTRSSASSTSRLPTTARRSGSIRRCPNITTIAGSPMPR